MASHPDPEAAKHPHTTTTMFYCWYDVLLGKCFMLDITGSLSSIHKTLFWKASKLQMWDWCTSWLAVLFTFYFYRLFNRVRKHCSALWEGAPYSHSLCSIRRSNYNHDDFFVVCRELCPLWILVAICLIAFTTYQHNDNLLYTYTKMLIPIFCSVFLFTMTCRYKCGWVQCDIVSETK